MRSRSLALAACALALAALASCSMAARPLTYEELRAPRFASWVAPAFLEEPKPDAAEPILDEEKRVELKRDDDSSNKREEGLTITGPTSRSNDRSRSQTEPEHIPPAQLLPAGEELPSRRKLDANGVAVSKAPEPPSSSADTAKIVMAKPGALQPTL
jgi:hypothetical protein